ncbi:MAG TPA: hypothetical protein P5523_08405 [Bacteroidales bacterium]|nr:hypothetical protein [Bacteroidales bacterium]
MKDKDDMPVTNFQPQTRICPLCGDTIVYTVYLNWWRAKISIKEKDEVRQRNIIKTLNPKHFWRYNSVSKIWVNVKDTPDAQLAWKSQ